MSPRLSRRQILVSATALMAQAAAARAQAQVHPLYGGAAYAQDPALFPPPESPTDFPIVEVSSSQIPRQFRRQVTPYTGTAAPGTIIVDPSNRHLYYTLENYEAMRYGVGVGRAGFEWSGDAVVGMKRRWPRWLPPTEMVYRDEKAQKWSNGMPGGPENPLGARALYLFSNGEDTLYRIHGTNEPASIGKALSSGCIRMLNQDVAELYDRVQINTPVVVMSSQAS
jgi:lipoprotein-anchoring transpeptidase ErfK/SrfK